MIFVFCVVPVPLARHRCLLLFPNDAKRLKSESEAVLNYLLGGILIVYSGDTLRSVQSRRKTLTTNNSAFRSKKR